MVAGLRPATPARVVADFVHDRIEGARRDRVSPPIVRYREAVLHDRRVLVHEIEGPAEEVERLLRERAACGG